MTEVITNSWIHPTTGEVRRYINNWQEIAGFDVSYYNTGNVSSFSFDGYRIANGRYCAIRNLKFYLTDDEKLHSNSSAQDWKNGRLGEYVSWSTIIDHLQDAINQKEK